jgi:hypothetical protein
MWSGGLADEEGQPMPTVVAGLVKNGVVVPNVPLPEGAFVEVHMKRGSIEVPADFQEELDGWQFAGGKTLETVERLAQESDANESWTS